MKQVAAAEFESEVLRSKEPVLVDFFTGWPDGRSQIKGQHEEMVWGFCARGRM